MPISVIRPLHHDLNIKILLVSTVLLLLSCKVLFLCEIENTKSDAKTYICLLYIALKSMSLPFSTNYDMLPTEGRPKRSTLVNSELLF